MTTKRIAYERPDGGVSVIVPSPVYVQRLMDRGMTEAEAVEAVRQKDTPDEATRSEVLESADLPPRKSRDRWRIE